MASGGMVLVLDDMVNQGNEIVTTGIVTEFVDRMKRMDGAVYPPAEDCVKSWEMWQKWSRWGCIDFHQTGMPQPIIHAVAFDRDAWKRTSLDLVKEAGVNLRLHSWFSEAIVEGGKVQGVICQTKLGRQALMAEKETQNSLLASIKKNESKYAASLKKKQQEARRIDREIDKLIRAAIAASNKKSGKKGSSTKFALTPEAKLVADNFSANKGRHIWPVERGIISKGFGVYKDAVYPGIKHQNNGVIIATDAGTPARSIFKGEVIAILSVPGGNLGVQVKHGNYITTYYNLSKLYVKKGDKVAAKEALGEIYTNRNTQQTRLKFYLYQDSKKLNPQQWIHPL